VLIDAIVLAGGRSRRLGEVPKAGLAYRQQTLLEHAVNAVSFARTTVVVGETVVPLPHVLTTREEPAFGGPAAAIAAGLQQLSRRPSEPSDFTFVLACDMPAVRSAITALRDGLGGIVTDGVIAVDAEQHLQPLAAAYRTTSLAAATAAHGGNLEGLAVFRLIADLELTRIAVPPGSTDDVDTWEDAARFGIAHPNTMEET
jgi:molybdopterin-guanine dinucleotide biosynthesis protein A